MPLEVVSKIEDLNPSWPLGPSDPVSEGDDHIRNLKVAVRSLLTDIAQIGFGVVELTLSQPTTEVTYSGPVKPGGIVTVILKQDATGGRAITWGTVFKGAGADIDRRANMASVFQFVGTQSGNLVICGMPILGVQL